MSDHWRDLHRDHATRRFLPRPGAKGFKEPVADQAEDEGTVAPTKPPAAPSAKGMRLMAARARCSS